MVCFLTLCKTVVVQGSGSKFDPKPYLHFTYQIYRDFLAVYTNILFSRAISHHFMLVYTSIAFETITFQNFEIVLV